MNQRAVKWLPFSAAWLAVFISAPSARAFAAPERLRPRRRAGVKGRHVRVENPTGWMMDWRQIQILSGGKDIVRGHGEMFSGTVWPDHNVKTRDGREMTDGTTDPSKRGPCFVARHDNTTGYKELNPWFEIDLGRTTDIDRIVLYGSRYPQRMYLDKGHRVVTVLDEGRRVVWAMKFDYYDRAASQGGIFTLEPKAGEKSPALGTHVPDGVGSWVPMSWLLVADKVPPLPDAERRMRRFAGRNSPSEIAKLAKGFFPLLDDRIPELAEAHRLYAARRYQRALDSWKEYWFAKMKRVNMHAALRGDYWAYRGNGDDLVDGIAATISATSARAIRFTPGQIRWIHLPDRKDPGWKNALTDSRSKAEVNKVARPLFDAYMTNPDPRYMRRWSEITDDWAMNFFEDAAKCPYEVENLFTFNPCHPWGTMMEGLADLAERHPKVVGHIPSVTLARVQLVCLEKYSTAWWRQARETIFNHVTGGVYAWDTVLPYVDEFHPGQRARRERLQAFERFIVMATERDGSLAEIGDEGHQEIPVLLGFNLRRAEMNRPSWYTPGWRNRALEWYDNLYAYMFRHLAPGGFEHRFAVDYRPKRWTTTTEVYFPQHPKTPPMLSRDDVFFTKPEVRRLLDAFGHISSGRPRVKDPVLKPIVEKQQRAHDAIGKLLGNEKPGMPRINSDWMPYTGAYYFRGGWEDEASFLAMMACGSHGGSQAPQWPYGMIYHYDYNHPLVAARPVHVDGLPPQQLFGRMNCFQPGTKTMALTNADEKPARHRWLSNERFDFGEAVFRGGYQRYPGFEGDWDGPGLKQRDAGRAVADTHTIRQIIQARGSRLFIVTDATRTPGETAHEFSVPYVFSLSTRKKGATRPFGPGQLVIDQKRGRVRSDNPDGPSVTLHQFAGSPLRYHRDRDAKVDTRKYSRRLGSGLGFAEQRVSAKFKGNGFALVSVISSRDRGRPERIASIEPLDRDGGVVGFHAKLKDGGEIWYRSAGLGEGKLVCGPGRATGQALLVVKDSNRGLSGILLTGRNLTLGGRRIRTRAPDFEFTMVGRTTKTTAIYTPIDPVSFLPDRNAFIGGETVTMVSKTPNVEIRYTTDGTPPTRTSRRYTGPVRITQTTEFAARAYRLGPGGRPLPSNDFEINGTKFSVPSYGWFHRKQLKPAARVAERELEPGLDYDYLQAPWWRLYASAHWLPAAGGGASQREMDLSNVATNDHYGMRYKGYLKVPRDGLYTFHAPRELMYMDNAPSYDLRVYIDGEEWYLTQWWHGHGTWTVPLGKGFHRFQVDFADARTTPWRKSGIWRYYPRPWAVYQGKPSDILVTGPGLDRERIPKDWLYRERR